MQFQIYFRASFSQKLPTKENVERKRKNSINTHEKKSWTNEITTRKKLGPTKYPR